MKKLLTLSLSLFPLLAFAVSFEQNGISYETNGEQTVSVIQRSNDKYSGNLDIPSEISYQGTNIVPYMYHRNQSSFIGKLRPIGEKKHIFLKKITYICQGLQAKACEATTCKHTVHHL